MLEDRLNQMPQRMLFKNLWDLVITLGRLEHDLLVVPAYSSKATV